MYSLYEHLKYFTFKQKNTTCVSRPSFFSYDYGARNLDEYFHFDSIAGQVQNEENFFKNLNNCMS